MAYALFCQKFACKKLPFIRYKKLSTNVAELNSFFLYVCLYLFGVVFTDMYFAGDERFDVIDLTNRNE